MANAISTFGVVTTSTPQLFSLGVGGTLSSTATRTDKFDSYWTITELSKRIPKTPVGHSPDGAPIYALCNREESKSDPFVREGYTPAKSSPLITEDEDGLGITKWLLGALLHKDLMPSVTGPRSLKAEEVAAEREELNDYRFKDYRFTTAETAQIVASGAFTSSLVEQLDDDPELQNPELKKNSQLYRKKLKEKVKEKLKKELDKLLNPGKVTPAQIAQFFGSGGSPSELQGLLNGGYDQPEIADILSAKKKAGAFGGGGGSGGGGPKPDTLTIEIKFIIVSNGNVLPTWKLVRVSSGTGSTPLFGIGRTRNHDVIITIGPKTIETANTHLASQIGVAVANANASAARSFGTTPSNTLTLPPFF